LERQRRDGESFLAHKYGQCSRDARRCSRGAGDNAAAPIFVAEDLADGKLVQLLPQYELPKTVVTALYPRSIVPSLALRTLLDILLEWCH